MSGDALTTGVATMTSIATNALDLFTYAPLNYVVYAGLLGIGIGIVAKFIPKKRK